MKIEEAKSILMNNLVLEVSTPEADKDYTDALNEGIKALEKQIPKEPTIEPSFGAYCCPSCGIILIGRVEAGKRVEIKHCNECGQAIKWVK